MKNLIYEDFLLENLDTEPVDGAGTDSKIAQFFNGKNVFVTGATGFLGKLLVEKLLRSCPEIEGIFVLVRPKRGEDEYTRIKSLYSDVVFSRLRHLKPKFEHYIHIIRGDISMPGLGISNEDRQLIIQKVNVIFHIAAIIKFNEKLNMATAINIRGTRDLLDISKECNDLHSFLHVSTAYSNCNQEEITESFYRTPYSPQEMIDLVEETPEKVLTQTTKKMLGKWPNTYAFTKAISENCVKEYEGLFPISICRPAIVIATYKEPLRSWVDNINGATGMLLAASTGMMKSIHCHGEKSAEVVPADYVTNCMIAAAYKAGVEKPKSISLYNYVSSVENRITWKKFGELNRKYGESVPSVRSFWYYCLVLNRYRPIHRLNVVLLQYFPALLTDLLLVMTGKKAIMVNVCKKVTKMEVMLSFFMTNEWKFHNDNTRELWQSLSEDDKKLFPFSMEKLDWEDFHRTHPMGLRTYVMKEDPATLPAARKQMNRLYLAHLLVKFTTYSILILLIQYILGLFW